MSEESHIPKFELGDFLRLAVSGGIAIGAFFFCSAKVKNWSISVLSADWPIIGFATVLIGTMIYGLHRGLTNLVAERFRFRLSKEHLEILIPDKVRKKIVQHWKFRSNEDRVIQTGYLRNWADIVHATYTSAVGMLAGAAVSWSLFEGVKLNNDSLLATVGVALVLLAAGFINDCRRHRVEECLYEDWEKLKTPIPPTPSEHPVTTLRLVSK